MVVIQQCCVYLRKNSLQIYKREKLSSFYDNKIQNKLNSCTCSHIYILTGCVDLKKQLHHKMEYISIIERLQIYTDFVKTSTIARSKVQKSYNSGQILNRFGHVCPSVFSSEAIKHSLRYRLQIFLTKNLIININQFGHKTRPL